MEFPDTKTGMGWCDVSCKGSWRKHFHFIVITRRL